MVNYTLMDPNYTTDKFKTFFTTFIYMNYNLSQFQPNYHVSGSHNATSTVLDLVISHIMF